MLKDIDKMFNIAIAAGGSGGHIFPGIAIAQTFSIKNLGNIIFVGRKDSIEEKIIKENGFPFYGITAAGFVGKDFFTRIKSILLILKGIKQSLKILHEQKIHLVLGTGSYVSVPVVLAAKKLSIPVILQEQNVIPGKANRFLARFAEKICLSYPESKKYFPEKKCFITGNPVRKEILNLKKETNKTIKILILGGSQGARAINEAFCAAWPYLKEKEIQFIHQTGEKDFLWVREFYEKNNIPGKVFPFLKDMAWAYAQANLVISRAGATTLAEITLIGLPSILIPYPWAIGHQLYNAKVLEKAGAAVVIPQEELTGKRLAETILDLIKNNQCLKKMTTAALNLGKPEAAEKIVALCLEVFREKSDEITLA